MCLFVNILGNVYTSSQLRIIYKAKHILMYRTLWICKQPLKVLLLIIKL